MKLFAEIRARFEWAHRWPGAPEYGEYALLRNLHRHEFHVILRIGQEHSDRDVEYLEVKAALVDFLEEAKGSWPESSSCEQIGEAIVAWARERYPGVRPFEVTVLEDGENGAALRFGG